jgi:hypothetical protein
METSLSRNVLHRSKIVAGYGPCCAIACTKAFTRLLDQRNRGRSSFFLRGCGIVALSHVYSDRLYRCAPTTGSTGRLLKVGRSRIYEGDAGRPSQWGSQRPSVGTIFSTTSNPWGPDQCPQATLIHHDDHLYTIVFFIPGFFHAQSTVSRLPCTVTPHTYIFIHIQQCSSCPG